MLFLPRIITASFVFDDSFHLEQCECTSKRIDWNECCTRDLINMHGITFELIENDSLCFRARFVGERARSSLSLRGRGLGRGGKPEHIPRTRYRNPAHLTQVIRPLALFL